ncbi:MAG: MlaD family protein [Chitinophagaceae bacterium]
MKISNEAKVGILAVVAILVLILGFNFLKGKSLFSKTPTIYAVFANLGGLEKSNQVKINGLAVGTVYNFAPKDKEVSSIIVEIHLTRDINIPRNSIAFIDASLVGASHITIDKGDAAAYLSSGDTISTKIEGGIIGDLKTQLTPTLTRINQTLDSLRKAISGIGAIFDPATNSNVQTLVARMAISSAHLQELLNSQTGALAKSLNNLNSVTGNLAKNNESISSSLRNVEVTTTKLANAPIQETLQDLQSTINEFKGTATELKNTITQLSSKDGSLGLLMKDRKLYDELNRVLLSAEILFDDIRLNPKRYVNISIIGGRAKSDPITSPSLKDTIPLKFE